MPRRKAAPLMATLGDFAVLFDISPRTADTWRARGILPAPDLDNPRRPVWLVDNLERWAKDTGRTIDRTALIAAREDGQEATPRKART